MSEGEGEHHHQKTRSTLIALAGVSCIPRIRKKESATCGIGKKYPKQVESAQKGRERQNTTRDAKMLILRKKRKPGFEEGERKKKALWYKGMWGTNPPWSPGGKHLGSQRGR